MQRSLPCLTIALVLVVSACGDDASAPVSETTIATSSSTTTSTLVDSVDTTTTPTVFDDGTVLVREGDVTPTARAFQWLLNCNGYGALTVDGVFGPASLAALETAQAALGLPVTGSAGETTFSMLSRTCSDARPLEIADHDFGTLNVVGNAAAADPEVFSLRVADGDQLFISIRSGNGISVNVLNSAGIAVGTQIPDAGWETIFTAGGDYSIQVSAADESDFVIRLEFFKSDPPVDSTASALGVQADAIPEITLRPNGLGNVGLFGDDAETVVTALTSVLGPPGFDSGWTPMNEVFVDITDPDRVWRRLTWRATGNDTVTSSAGDYEAGSYLNVEFRDTASPFATEGTRHFVGYDLAWTQLRTPVGIGSWASSVDELLATTTVVRVDPPGWWRPVYAETYTGPAGETSDLCYQATDGNVDITFIAAHAIRGCTDYEQVYEFE